MKNLSAKLTSFVKNNKILAIFLALIFALCLWWAWGAFAPHPLGSKMEYLGKENFGNILGFDSQPYSEYYYGTDMEPKELGSYFNKASLEHSQQETPGSSVMIFNSDSNEFSIVYYTDKSETSFSTHKKYIVSVISSQYETAKSYMKQ